MKILHIIAQLPSKTGSGVYFSNLIRVLKRYDYKQKAVFAVQDGFEFSELSKNDQYPLEFKKGKLDFPITGMSYVMPYESSNYFELSDEQMEIWKDEFTKVLLKAKDEFEADIVICHHLWILSSIAVDIFTESKCFAICHSTDLRQAIRHPNIVEKEVRNINKFDKIITVSNDAKKDIINIFAYDKNKLYNLAGGFNEEVFYPDDNYQRNKDIELVFAAKIDSSKGIFELVKAFKNINKEYENLKLDIIGSPDKENKIRLDNLIADNKNISQYNVKNQEELAGILRKKDIFIMPSYFEGLGLIAVESLASGILVVSTKVEGLISFLSDDINKSGLIEYVDLPRLYDMDKPYEEDLDKFVCDLGLAIEKQIKRLDKKKELFEKHKDIIAKDSWYCLAEKFNELIKSGV